MKFKLVVVSFLSILGLVGALVTFAPSANAGLFENVKKDACGGAELKGTGSNCATSDTSQLNKTIQRIINILTVIIGIVAVIMILINGFKFITSGGDTNKVGSAKNGILYAVIGLIIVAVAQFIVAFAINTGSS